VIYQSPHYADRDGQTHTKWRLMRAKRDHVFLAS
jgi:hypothetical protein